LPALTVSIKWEMAGRVRLDPPAGQSQGNGAESSALEDLLTPKLCRVIAEDVIEAAASEALLFGAELDGVDDMLFRKGERS
jgi:hypothetical protein